MPEQRRLPLIPAAKVKPKRQTILTKTPDAEDGPLIRGEAGTDIKWTCGACDEILIEGMEPGKIIGLILRCPCGAYNDATV